MPVIKLYSYSTWANYSWVFSTEIIINVKWSFEHPINTMQDDVP